MSKAHDDSSRASKDPSRVAKAAADAKKAAADGATPRRVRPGGPRERSGPIGITSGDFATPLVRKRTTTQPRGTPILGTAMAPQPSLDEPVKAGAPATIDDEAVTPPPVPAPESGAPQPEPAPPPVGAMPSEAVDAIPQAMPTRPPPPHPNRSSPGPALLELRWGGA